MSDDRNAKTLIFGIIEGETNDVSGSHVTEDITQWCGAGVQQLSYAALERRMGQAIVKKASSTNGC